MIVVRVCVCVCVWVCVCVCGSEVYLEACQDTAGLWLFQAGHSREPLAFSQSSLDRIIIRMRAALAVREQRPNADLASTTVLRHTPWRQEDLVIIEISFCAVRTKLLNFAWQLDRCGCKYEDEEEKTGSRC